MYFFYLLTMCSAHFSNNTFPEAPNDQISILRTHLQYGIIEEPEIVLFQHILWAEIKLLQVYS